jgi:twitching motility protein PilT
MGAVELHALLEAMSQHEASDLHLQAGAPAMVRIHGKLTELKTELLTEQLVRQFFEQMTNEPTRAKLEQQRSADFAYRVEELARFRVAAFYQRQSLTISMRMIPSAPLPLDELNLPSAIREIAQIERGLVVVTGTTGSGKSTTLAGIIDYINENRHNRILTIEDPIEFVHPRKKALIAQREIGSDATDFLSALRAGLRQDPDVILIGELRDQETMATALQAADTGHAVFSTIHTTTAAQTIQRIIAMFPADQRDLLLLQLAMNLEAVVSQRLARTTDGKARLPIVEILRGTPLVRQIILDREISKLDQVIANRENGMQLFDQHLTELYKGGIISGTEAMRLADNPEAVSLAKSGISTSDLSGGLVRRK